ncbi:hypothetical protein MSA03_19200 [Microbacterium saccharophilum]|nr:hypothetical protein MSA03_19200 [Microbacterium saccharophilum]
MWHVAALILQLAIAPMAASACGAESAWTACPVENTGTEVTIGASQTRPGRDPLEGNGRQPPSTSVPINPGCTDPLDRCDILYEVELLREVTLNDLASFAPQAPPLTGQPTGVAIVGMPANFVVDADTHTVTGELFDLPVSVRFTPVSYLFVHGDGTAREAPTGGATWEELGQPQFSATATSHAYGSRGTFTAHAAVRYSAAVDFGNGWAAVPGILELSTGAYAVDVLEVRTALVERTCVEDPGGPGC